MADEPMDPPDDLLEIKLTEQPPVCRYAGRRAAEPCWGSVLRRPEFPDTYFVTCVGHACTDFNGRYYTEAYLNGARKTGGRLYPTFQPLPEAVRPEVDPELEELWYVHGDKARVAAGWPTRAEEDLRTVNDALARTKLPREEPPPPSVPPSPLPTHPTILGMAVEGGQRIVILKEVV